MGSKPPSSWGFFGGTLEWDGKGYTIILHDGSNIYLKYNEARSVISIIKAHTSHHHGTKKKREIQNGKVFD